jgi:hypothetical protein
MNSNGSLIEEFAYGLPGVVVNFSYPLLLKVRRSAV